MGVMETLARCPHKACPVRWRTGPDRWCADHAPGAVPTIPGLMPATPNRPAVQKGHANI
jgi:hypothetical protein